MKYVNEKVESNYIKRCVERIMKEDKNLSLKAKVLSMYKERFRMEGLFRPRITENLKISGKRKDHVVDIYFEFIQMNNLQRTIIKIVEGTEVTENDIWEFANVLKDLHFYAKGILYYDGSVSYETQKMAKKLNIDVLKFDFWNEIQNNVIKHIKIMLPSQEIIGDPFWVSMEMTADGKENTGTYNMIDNCILLFLSKKQAENYCCKLKNYKVFGISQNQLRILISLQEKKLSPEFVIAFPEFEQIKENSILAFHISHEKFKKFYLRG